MSSERKHEIPPSLYFLEDPNGDDIAILVEERMSSEELAFFREFSEVFEREFELHEDYEYLFEDVFAQVPHTRAAVNKYIALYQSLSGRDM